MLSAILMLALSQDTVAWLHQSDQVYETADRERKLVLIMEPCSDSEIAAKEESFFDDPKVVKATGRFVCTKRLRMASTPYGTDQLPGGTLRFLDKDRNVRGLAYAPMDPDLFAKWCEGVDAAWRKHDSLVFRSKGRLTYEDSARLAFSYALRGQTDQASTLLASIPVGRRVDESEFALMALALAYATAKNDADATTTWLKLESMTRSPVLQSAARTGAATNMVIKRPKEAFVKFKVVLASKDSPATDKWWADLNLKRLKEAGIDGG